MSLSVKLKGRKKEWRLSTENPMRYKTQTSVNDSLSEVLNVSFTDYCSVRTKKKLDEQVRYHPRKPILFFKGKVQAPRYNQKEWLTVHPIKVQLQKQNNYLKQKRDRINNKKTLLNSGSRFTKDWISRKLMELEMMDDQNNRWMEANGQKVKISSQFKMKNREQEGGKNPFVVYKHKGSTLTVRKNRSENTSIFRERRHRTVYSKSQARPKESYRRLDQSIVLNGWEHQNQDKEF